MSLKSDIGRIRQIDDLDRDAFIAAKRRHEARLIVLDYERFHRRGFDAMDDLIALDPSFAEDDDKYRQRIETEVATARDYLGEDNLERWTADQNRIERYLLRVNGNLDEAQRTRAWGADPDTMWNHQQEIRVERKRQREEKIHAIITKRFAVEQVKGSPIRFDINPRYGTPIYEDGSTGDPDLYPSGWSWPLTDNMDIWLIVIDECDEIPLSDEDRWQEITKLLEKEFDFDFALLCPAPNEQFPKFEHIQYL